MPIVTIVKAFTFQHDNGYHEVIPPGTYDLEEDMANHFYVRAHSDNPPTRPVRVGMSQFEAANAAGNKDAPTDERKPSVFKKAQMEPRSTRPNERPTLDDKSAA